MAHHVNGKKIATAYHIKRLKIATGYYSNGLLSQSAENIYNGISCKKAKNNNRLSR
jgi:hypothetical protein